MDPVRRSRRLALATAIAVAILGGCAAGTVPSPTASQPAPTLAPIATRWASTAEDGSIQVHLYFGWTSTCPHCAKARPFIDTLAADLPWLVVHSYQLDGHEENVALLQALASSIGETVSAVPAFLFDEQLVTGFDSADQMGAELRNDLEAYHARLVAAASAPPGTAAPGASPSIAPITLPFLGSIDPTTVSLPLVTVVLAGLDAFNPCALSVLLFLLSLLAVSRSRTRMALVGGVYVLVSGLAYFLFMAAWLNVFLLMGALRVVTLIAGALAVAAALVNIKDYAWFGRGFSLVIPERAKPSIFGRMIDATAATRLPVMLAGTALVAVAANLYEALCTGGFPVVFTRIITLQNLPTAAYYGWLLLYNVVYVIPLILVVIVFTVTLGSHTVSKTEARTLKLLSGLLMLGLGLLLLVAPDRLTDFTVSIGVFVGAFALWAAIVGIGRLRAAAARGGLRGA